MTQGLLPESDGRVVVASGPALGHHEGGDPPEPVRVAERPGEPLRLVEVLPHAHPLAEREERVPKVDVEVDGQLGRLPGLGETAEGPERLLQVGHGFAVGGPRHGPEPGLAEIGDRLLPQLPAQGMMGQPLGLLGDALGREPLEGLGDAGVEGALPVVEQPLVRHLVRERVLERVLEVRKEPGLVEELRGLEVRETASKPLLRKVGHRLEQGERHVRPDDGRGLEQALLVGGQAVDAGGQDRLHRRGHLDAGQGCHQAVGAALADQHVGLDQRADALLQEEGVPFRPLDQERQERTQGGVVPQEGVQEGVRALRRQRVEPELGVEGPAPPAVLVFGAVVDEEEDPRCRKALDETVQQGLGLGIDPVQILEHEEQGLPLRLAEQEPLDRLERPLPPLRWVERLPRAVIDRHVEQGEEGGEARLQASVEREELAHHLLAHPSLVVTLLDLEVPLEQVDHRQIRGRFAHTRPTRPGGRATRAAMRVRHLPDEPGLPHARLPDEGHDLAVPGGRAPERLAELLHLAVPADEPGQPPGGRRLQPRPDRSRSSHLVDLDGAPSPLTVIGPSGVTPT